MFKKMTAVFLALLISSTVFAGIKLKPGPQLWVYSTASDLGSVKQLIVENAFDSKALGRALFHLLRRGTKNGGAEQIKLAGLLIANGADVNFSAMNGKNTLMVAAKRKDIKAVRLLLENGAKNELVDGNGKNAIAHARSAGSNTAVVDLLTNPPKANPLEVVQKVVPPKIADMDLYMEGEDVIIDYSLVATVSACIKIIGSTDGGTNFDMVFKSVSGDIGEPIEPGEGKRIVWEVLNDYPRGIDDLDVVLDLIATRCLK